MKNADGEKCREICKLESPFKEYDLNGNFINDGCENDDVDDDKDGIPNSKDNCPQLANNNQLDKDNDGDPFIYPFIAFLQNLQELVISVMMKE